MEENSFVDLRIGNTDLLKEMLGYSMAQLDFFQNEMLSGMDYNKEGPLESVKNVIKDLHDKYHPGLMTDKSKVVIGSGASQLISCFFHLNQKSHIQSPFWLRTPILAKLHSSEVECREDLKHIESIKLITYPNNPDGSLFVGKNKNDWYDCVYLWPWYFDNRNLYDNAVSNLTTAPRKAIVFSLSKMTGHCGTRFGWAIVEDEDTYKEICNYMEYESGGLGFDTQMKASQVIYHVIYDNSWSSPLEEVGRILIDRKKQLQIICQRKNWKYDQGPGMFGWITSNSENVFYDLQSMGILATTGSKCGGSSSQIRLNLAVDSKTWNKFLSAIG